jgi:hypothetical protein
MDMPKPFVLSLSFVAVVASVGSAQPQQPPASAQPPATSQQSTSPQANQTVNVTGCVAAGPNNTFTLTASAASAVQTPPTGTTAVTPAGEKVAKTITYTLTGSTDLESHVGHTVQVTGVEQAPQVSTKTDERSAGAAAPRGTSGSTGAAPKVETTAQTQIVVRQLTVNNIKMVKNSCELIK